MRPKDSLVSEEMFVQPAERSLVLSEVLDFVVFSLLLHSEAHLSSVSR